MATQVPADRRTVSIPDAAKQLGIGRNLAYELARRNALPVPVIPIGSRRMVVSRAALDAVLAAGSSHPESEAA
jgi:predicted DNA-binding transcriptional regulator AlpA